jgi:hypothetical protein
MTLDQQEAIFLFTLQCAKATRPEVFTRMLLPKGVTFTFFWYTWWRQIDKHEDYVWVCNKLAVVVAEVHLVDSAPGQDFRENNHMICPHWP